MVAFIGFAKESQKRRWQRRRTSCLDDVALQRYGPYQRLACGLYDFNVDLWNDLPSPINQNQVTYHARIISIHRKPMISLIMLTSWEVWSEQNTRVFAKNGTLPSTIICKIKDSVRIKAIVSECEDYFFSWENSFSVSVYVGVLFCLYVLLFSIKDETNFLSLFCKNTPICRTLAI